MKGTGWLVLLSFVPGLALADTGDPPGRVARVSYTQGVVSLEPSAEDQWARVSVNDTVTTGDRIYTDAKSRAELEVGPYTVHMSESTDVTVTNLDDQLLQIGLAKGTIRVTVFSLPDDNSVEVDTPNGALALLRAGSYRVDAPPDTDYTQVLVSRGSMEVSSTAGAQAIQGGEAARLTGTGPIEVAFQARPDPDAFDTWCRDRDRRVRACLSKKYVAALIPGVADLDSAGRWQSVAGYGDVWYPSGVPAGWVPYSHGHWAWVEPWGWTWVDRDTWGFAPFHYGRWARVGSAWAWVPGPSGVAPVYSPALVAFVGGSGAGPGIAVGAGSIQAWFPLGPKEPYFPSYHSSSDYLRRVNQANVRDIRDIGGFVNPAGAARIRYANRQPGTTVVPTEAFQNGQRVGQRVLKNPPKAISGGLVISHPDIAPTELAAFRGNAPARAPKFATPPPPRPQFPQRPGIAAPPARPGVSNVRPAPSAPVTRPGTAPGVRPAPSAPVTRPGTAPGVRPSPSAPVTRPDTAPARPVRLIVRNPPPPTDVPFVVRKPVLDARPGRPLEPQQKQDLRQGKLAGPAKDKELPPRPVRTKENPPQRSQPAPTPRSQPAPSPPQRRAPPDRAPARPAPSPPQRQAPPDRAPAKPAPSPPQRQAPPDRAPAKPAPGPRK